MKQLEIRAGLSLMLVLCFGVVRMQAQQGAAPSDKSPAQARRPIVAEPEMPRIGTDPGAAQNVAVPRLVKFSGTMRDQLGHVPSGVVGVTFAIYKDREGGAALWLETQNVQLDEQGHYAVLLGATKNEGLPMELFAAAESRWLGVQANLPGELEQQRVLLVSVPYALKAADAENLGGMPASSYALTGVAGGTGNRSKAGASTVASVNANANSIPVFLDNTGTLGNSLLVQNGNSMAVGQGVGGNPTVQFDVNGGIRGTGLATGGRNTTTDAINTGALFLGGSNAMGVVGANAVFASGALFTRTSFYSGGAERMTILGATGNVGIGTTTPAATLDVNGSLNLPNTTSPTVGVISLGGAAFLHNFGTGNTFVGSGAGNMSMSGFSNSAFGSNALHSNTVGENDSAFGHSALQSNNFGQANSAFGAQALQNNTSGGFNSAFGAGALLNSNNTNANNASGNSAFGWNALVSLLTGNHNIAIGVLAGDQLMGDETNDILIGSFGVTGESNTIRIGGPITAGGPTQTAAFIAGISGATSAAGVGVFVNANGQLGTLTSSQRFKHAIANMGAESDLLMKLRPVAFYYKPELDETQTRQYGLVAEEVAQVAPDLVVFDKDGQPQTVRYHFVNAMLLNEVQKQRRTILQQQAEIKDLAARLAKLEASAAPKP
jgi:hypothetical protein